MLCADRSPDSKPPFTSRLAAELIDEQLKAVVDGEDNDEVDCGVEPVDDEADEEDSEGEADELSAEPVLLLLLLTAGCAMDAWYSVVTCCAFSATLYTRNVSITPCHALSLKEDWPRKACCRMALSIHRW